MKTRKVKLYRKYRAVTPRHYRIVPELRISGDWLAAVGFKAGLFVEIEVSENQLLMKLKNDDDS